MSLLTALNKQEIPTVTAILADIKEAKESKPFSKVTTNEGKDYYFLTSEVMAIDSAPDKHIVRHSSKHDAYFIVPLASDSTFNKF